MFTASRRLCAATVCALAALALGNVQIAHADNLVLFSNLPNLRKNCWIGRTVTGPANPVGNNGYQAHAFFFSPTATDTLDHVLAPILAHTNATTNAMTVTLTTAMNGTANFPGGVPDTTNVLEQWSFTDAPIQDLEPDGSVAIHSDPNMILPSVNRPTLQAGVGYWLIGTAPGNAVMDWNTSQAEEGYSTGFVAISTTPPSPNASDKELPTQWTQYGSAANQGAFRIYGATVVPEASTLALAAAGLGLLGVGVRRRKVYI